VALTLMIDVDPSPVMHSTPAPKLRTHYYETDELPAVDVTVTLGRPLPPHLIRHILAEAADRLISDAAPRLKLGPTKRKAA
jgi:hypothetical protein